MPGGGAGIAHREWLVQLYGHKWCLIKNVLILVVVRVRGARLLNATLHFTQRRKRTRHYRAQISSILELYRTLRETLAGGRALHGSYLGFKQERRDGVTRKYY